MQIKICLSYCVDCETIDVLYVELGADIVQRNRRVTVRTDVVRDRVLFWGDLHKMAKYDYFFHLIYFQNGEVFFFLFKNTWSMKKENNALPRKVAHHIKTRISQLWYRIYSKWILISELTKKKVGDVCPLRSSGAAKSSPKRSMLVEQTQGEKKRKSKRVGW